MRKILILALILLHAITSYGQNEINKKKNLNNFNDLSSDAVNQCAPMKTSKQDIFLNGAPAIGTDNREFTITEIPFNWIDISTVGANTGIHADDIVTGPFPIGFSFPFFDGITYDQIWVSSNGWCSFSSQTSSAYSNYSIPNSNIPNNIVALLWDDLNLNSSGNIYYYHDAANSRFIVSYDAVPYYSGGGAVSAQFHLYYYGAVDMMFGTLSGNLNSCTVGLENAAGSDGIQATYNGSGPYNPESNYGLHFSENDPQLVIVSLIPLSSLTIPAGGGILNFNIQAENLDTTAVRCDIWTTISLPSGSVYGPIINTTRTFNAGQLISRNRNQTIPASAPAGAYTYNAYSGLYPQMPWSEDHFTFTKSATDIGGTIFKDWSNWGEEFGNGDDLSQLTVENYVIMSVYPNPFNPATTISFELLDANFVSLRIFDVQGREVDCLKYGHLYAGKHEFTFDGSGLSSGMYFAILEAGDFKQTVKLLLMK